MSDTKLIKPEDQKSGTLTAKLEVATTAAAYLSPVPEQAPGTITLGVGTSIEETVFYKSKDAEAGTINELTRDYTNRNGGVGSEHQNGAAWEVMQNALYMQNMIDAFVEGYYTEPEAVAKVDDTSFTVAGSQLTAYTVGRPLRLNNSDSYLCAVVSSSYDAGDDETTIVIEGTTVPVLTSVEIGLQPKGVRNITDYDVIDEDSMSSDSADKVPTQQSVKAYADMHGLGMHRQAIMNGNFDVWQRGTSFTPATNEWTSDRWNNIYGVDGGTLPTDTITRQAITPGELENSRFFQRLTVNGAGSSLGDASFYWLRQKIENGNRFLCGDGKKVTVSFWAKSDIAGKKLGFHLQQNYGSGGSPSSLENIVGDKITLTSSWTKYTHTFTTNTLSGKTFGSNYDDTLVLNFMYQWGIDYASRCNDTVAEDFVGAGDIDIAQVQLCAGDVALPFQPKSVAQELADCQRYFEKSFSDEAPNNSTSEQFQYIASAYLTTDARAWIDFKTPKRTSPTITIYKGKNATTSGRWAYYTNTWNGGTGTSSIYENKNGFTVNIDGTFILRDCYIVEGHWTADAEL